MKGIFLSARSARSRIGVVITSIGMMLAVGFPGAVVQGASTPSKAKPVAISILKKQSHKESGLIIYGNAPAPYLKPVITAFNRLYPWIHVQDYDLTDNQVFSKYESEHFQGARSADLLISSGPALWISAEKNRLIESVTPQGLNHFPAFTDQGKGLYVMSPEPILTVYNEKMLATSDVPSTYFQLALDAKSDAAKYPLVSYPITNPLGYAAVYGLIHVLGATSFWNDLSLMAPNTKTFNEGLDGLTYLLQGGASVGYISSGLAQGVLQGFKGLAGYTFMSDATPLVPRGIAVAQGAKSPASAQLFLDYLFSNQGQESLCAAGFEASENGFAPTNGCTSDLTDLYKTVPRKNVYLVPFNSNLVNQQASITARWNKIFGLGN